MAANPQGNQNRTRTDSNAIITPSSPRSVIFGRSRSNARSSLFCGTGLGIDKIDINDVDGYCPSCSMPPSPMTLVLEHDGVSDMRVRTIIGNVLGIADIEEIDDETDFRSLGLDSLGSTEAQQALRVAFNKPIPRNIFSKCVPRSLRSVQFWSLVWRTAKWRPRSTMVAPKSHLCCCKSVRVGRARRFTSYSMEVGLSVIMNGFCHCVAMCLGSAILVSSVMSHGRI